VSTIEELLEGKIRGFGLEIREYDHRDLSLTTWHPLSAKVGTNFVNKWWSLGRYSLFADSGSEFSLVFSASAYVFNY
jgi:hypothetical protein